MESPDLVVSELTRVDGQVNAVAQTLVVWDICADDPQEAIEADLVQLEEADPDAQALLISVLDPDETSGNGTPLKAWFAE